MFESPKVELNLYLNDPELAARQIEYFLRNQPFEIRRHLQNIFDDAPLTKEVQKNCYCLDNLDDFGD